MNFIGSGLGDCCNTENGKRGGVGMMYKVGRGEHDVQERRGEHDVHMMYTC
jgi:hypothetical protein